MSKKNSSVSLKEIFNKQDNFTKAYSIFKKKITPYLNKKLCVAVSGGPDSLALTALTRALYYEKKFKIKTFINLKILKIDL